WVEETLVGAADYASLAIDDAGGVFFRYHVDEPFGGIRELRLSAKAQGVWETDTVSQAEVVGIYTALAMDSSGLLHACYVNAEGGDIRYVVQTGDGWDVQAVGQVGIDLSMALDPQGYPHVGFYDDEADAVCYAFMNGSGWHMETVQPDLWTGGGYTSVAVGNDGIACMIYRVNSELTYAVRSDSGWTIETVTPDQGFYTSLKLDAAGYPHIAHHSWADRMCYTYQDGAGWHTEVADNDGEGGMYCSLALDGAGFPHMTYFDNFPDDVRYAYKDAQGWHVETVDAQNDVGKHTSLAIDPQGRPCVSYLYGQAVDLRFAYRDAGAWHRATIASEGRVGEWSRLAVDDMGRPHVIYYDETRGDLMYAHADAVAADSWESGIVRSGTLTLLSVGPNPASTLTSISFNIRSEDPSRVQPTSIRLFDLSGREVRAHEYMLPAGEHQVSIPLTDLGLRAPTAGVYYLQVRVNDSSAQDGAPLIIVP
ncbi:MAG: T9SS type A sorting domain-containing protein, partial [Candidatus Eisenbacteria bacterium]|nr:T9SS type A sorting domain-containing protein [Candidatus Eisenbacteria bacterium]